MEPVVRTNNAISINLPNVNSGHGEVRDIPEGYMSLDEFGDLFHRKLDEAYAKHSIFGKRIIHGFFVGSLISAVFGTVLPGEGAIYLHQEMDFRKPVFHGEEIVATVVITKIKKEKSLLYFDTKCENSLGEIVIEGKAILKV